MEGKVPLGERVPPAAFEWLIKVGPQLRGRNGRGNSDPLVCLHTPTSGDNTGKPSAP